MLHYVDLRVRAEVTKASKTSCMLPVELIFETSGQRHGRIGKACRNSCSLS